MVQFLKGKGTIFTSDGKPLPIGNLISTRTLPARSITGVGLIPAGTVIPGSFVPAGVPSPGVHFPGTVPSPAEFTPTIPGATEETFLPGDIWDWLIGPPPLPPPGKDPYGEDEPIPGPGTPETPGTIPGTIPGTGIGTSLDLTTWFLVGLTVYLLFTSEKKQRKKRK